MALLAGLSCGRRETKETILLPVMIGGKVGYADLSGRMVCPPQFDDGGLFQGGLAVVGLNGKYGYIDTHGKIAIPARYDEALPFENGLALVGYLDTMAKKRNDRLFLREDMNWGAINKAGEFILEPKFKIDFKFRNSNLFTFLKNDSMGLMETTGKVIIPPVYENISSVGESIFYGYKGEHFYLFDSTGQTLTDLVFDDIDPTGYKYGLLAVKKGGKWGYIDTTGNMAIDSAYEEAFGFDANGHAYVKLNGKRGLIDRSGKYIIKPIYEDFWMQNDSLFSFKKKGRWGISDLSGRIIVEPKYESISLFKKYIEVELNNRHGIIDINGSWVIDPIYESIWIFDNLTFLCKDSKWKIIGNKDNKIFFDNLDAVLPVLSISHESKHYWCIRRKGKIGLIDSTGHLVLPMEFYKIYHVQDNIFAAYSKDKMTYYDYTGRNICESEKGF